MSKTISVRFLLMQLLSLWFLAQPLWGASLCKNVFKNKNSKISSLKTYYELFESEIGSRETVVLIHGLGSSRLTWGSVAKELAKKYRVVTYDQRGHGQSFYGGKDFSSKAMAQDLKNLLDELGVQQAHIVGHSMGGRTAIHFAAEFKDRARSVVIEDMHMQARDVQAKLDENQLANYERIPDQISKEQLRDIIKTHFTAEDLGLINVRALKELQLLVESRDGQHLDLTALKEHLKAVHRYNVEALNEDLSKVLQNAPGRIIFFAAAPTKKALLVDKGVSHIKKHRPDIKIIEFPESGHTIHAEKPQLYVKHLLDFFANQ